MPRLLSMIVAFTLVAAPAAAQETLRVRLNNGTPGGVNGTDGHICFGKAGLVVWLEQDTPPYRHVKTVKLWGQWYLFNLKDWAQKIDYDVDAVSEVTPPFFDIGLDSGLIDISMIPDGTYRVRLETDRCEVTNTYDTPDGTFTFTKDGADSPETGPFTAGPMTNILIDYSGRAGNSRPGVFAGPDIFDVMPAAIPERATATMTGVVSDDVGTPTITWTQVGNSDPAGGTATFADATDPATTVTFSDAGIYTLQLEAQDSQNAQVTTDRVKVYINSQVLIPDQDATVIRNDPNLNVGYPTLPGPDPTAPHSHKLKATQTATHANTNRFYIRFNVSTVNGMPVWAQMRLPFDEKVGISGHMRDVHILPDTEDGWVEDVITWNNQPCASGVPDGSTQPWVNNFDPSPAGWTKGWVYADLVAAWAVGAGTHNNDFMTFYVVPDPSDSAPAWYWSASRENYVTPELIVIEDWHWDEPPQADAGSDQLIVDTPTLGSETVALAGSASSDDRPPVALFQWLENAAIVASGATPNVALTLGVHDIDLYIEDNAGQSDTDAVQIIVDDRFNGNDVAGSAVTLTGSPGGTVHDDLMSHLSHASGQSGDWYLVNLVVVSDLTVDASFTHANGDLDLRLFESDGTTPVDTSASTSDDESVSGTNLVAGDYLINVSAAGGLSDANSYSLTVAIASTAFLSVGFIPNQADETAGVLGGAGTVTANAAPAGDLTVSLVSDIPGDLNLTTGTVDILSGTTSANFDVEVFDNGIVDGNRVATVTASAALHNDGAATFTVLDDDIVILPTVNWWAANAMVDENAGSIDLRVELSEVATATVTVPFTVGGSATAISDHDLVAGDLTINIGNDFATRTIAITDDSEVEIDENIVVNMGSPTNADAGATQSVTITIIDDDVEPDGGPPQGDTVVVTGGDDTVVTGGDTTTAAGGDTDTATGGDNSGAVGGAGGGTGGYGGGSYSTPVGCTCSGNGEAGPSWLILILGLIGLVRRRGR